MFHSSIVKYQKPDAYQQAKAGVIQRIYTQPWLAGSSRTSESYLSSGDNSYSSSHV